MVRFFSGARLGVQADHCDQGAWIRIRDRCIRRARQSPFRVRRSQYSGQWRAGVGTGRTNSPVRNWLIKSHLPRRNCHCLRIARIVSRNGNRKISPATSTGRYKKRSLKIKYFHDLCPCKIWNFLCNPVTLIIIFVFWNCFSFVNRSILWRVLRFFSL